MKEKKEWFESWFDSPYHGMLYQQRDEQEAQYFIDKLFAYLKPDTEAKVFDIACGDGRHAAYMSHFVHEVIGIDLSEARISKAKEHASEKLSFFRQDMRKVFRLNYFDFAVNFFTSFGYFQHYRDNVIAANAFAASLKPGGKLVLDYMNVSLVKQNLVLKEQKVIDNITFDLERKSEHNKIVKSISFKTEHGVQKHFQEVVSEFGLSDFLHIFQSSGLSLVDTFGDYDLNIFEENISPRLIMIFQKLK